MTQHPRRNFQLRAAQAGVLLVLSLAGLARTEAADLSKLPPASTRAVNFAKDIQPIFEERCLDCHGSEKQKGDFRLDLKAAALKGGETGKDILPGKSAESLLVHYVSGAVEDMRMPPKGKPLSAEQIGLLRAWIDQRAVWPEDGSKAALADKADHWTFKPATRPSLPAGREKAANPIDAFVLAKLGEKGLKPSVEADRRTLIRRLYYNLHGLPPSPEQTEKFLADQSPDAYEKLVDRLLDSQRYGERWGRHWLDTVHYGESHGYDKDKPRTNAWPYRDYVIRAFNADKPYDRFIQEQLAGDMLFPDQPEATVALGFIAAGPWDFVGNAELPESKTDGLIARYNDRDDMVMTTMSTFQSMTVHCARCHDHKFDPISQREYYQLQAVFAGVDRADRWYDTDPTVFTQRKAIMARRKSLEAEQKELDKAMAAISSEEIKALDARIETLKKDLKEVAKAGGESSGNGYHSAIEARADVEKWVEVDLGQVRPVDEVRLLPARPTDFPDTPGFGFPKRFRIEAASMEDFSDRKVLADHTSEDFANPGDTAVPFPTKDLTARYVRFTATRLWERTSDYVFALAELQVRSGTNNLALWAPVKALDSIEAGRWGKARLVDNQDSRKVLSAEGEPAERIAKRQKLEEEKKTAETERKSRVLALLPADSRASLDRVAGGLKSSQEELDALPKPQWVYAGANDFKQIGSFSPARQPRAVHLLRRGDVKQAGDLMPPGSLNCLPGLNGDFSLGTTASDGERRAALARWLTQPSNHQTRRTMVNRVWQYHFGRGLVETPNDFGHMGAAPSHPELLEWLSYWFQEGGESVKKLHKLILLSATYRQASQPNAENSKVDADNRYLWRMNRSRLDAECIHDSVLQISGKLDLTMGGPSVQQFYFKDDHSPIYDYSKFDVDGPGSGRRSVYRFIVRSVPDPFMDCLDAADPSILTARRNTTITALQALATWNDAFMIRQAQHAAAGIEGKAADHGGRIAELFRRALNRDPRPEEREQLSSYAARHGLANTCRLVLNSNEFLFVD